MDLLLKETGGGGDLVKLKNDLKTTEGIQNMVYLALFGGNPGHLTEDEREDQAFDWWGNRLFEPENPQTWFNSRTEHALNNIALTSAGIVRIEDAIAKDLEFMSDFADVDQEVVITDADRIEIRIEVEQLNSDNQTIIYLWDATKRELING